MEYALPISRAMQERKIIKEKDRSCRENTPSVLETETFCLVHMVGCHLASASDTSYSLQGLEDKHCIFQMLL